jgi:hypothetical protein
MGRNRLPKDDKKESFIIQIEHKYLKGQNKDELRLVAYESVVKHVELSKQNNNS